MYRTVRVPKMSIVFSEPSYPDLIFAFSPCSSRPQRSMSTESAPKVVKSLRSIARFQTLFA